MTASAHHAKPKPRGISVTKPLRTWAGAVLGSQSQKPNYPQVLSNISHLATVCHRKGDSEMALALHQQALAGFAVSGHPQAQQSAETIVSILNELGRGNEAAAIAAEYGSRDKLLSHRTPSGMGE